MEENKTNKYVKEGALQGAAGAAVGIVIAVGLISVLSVLMGTISGTAYEISEDQIDLISNTTVKTYVKDGIIAAFKAQKQANEFLPIIILGLVFAVVIAVIMNSVGGTAGGSAL